MPARPLRRLTGLTLAALLVALAGCATATSGHPVSAHHGQPTQSSADPESSSPTSDSASAPDCRYIAAEAIGAASGVQGVTSKEEGAGACEYDDQNDQEVATLNIIPVPSPLTPQDVRGSALGTFRQEEPNDDVSVPGVGAWAEFGRNTSLSTEGMMVCGHLSDHSVTVFDLGFWPGYQPSTSAVGALLGKVVSA